MTKRTDYIVNSIFITLILSLLGSMIFVYTHIRWENVTPYITQSDSISIHDVVINAKPLEEVVISAQRLVKTIKVKTTPSNISTNNQSEKAKQKEKTVEIPQTQKTSRPTPIDSNSMKKQMDTKKTEQKVRTTIPEVRKVALAPSQKSSEVKYFRPKRSDAEFTVPFRPVDTYDEDKPATRPLWADKRTGGSNPSDKLALYREQRPQTARIKTPYQTIDLLTEWPIDSVLATIERDREREFRIPEIYTRKTPYRYIPGKSYTPRPYEVKGVYKELSGMEQVDVSGPELMRQTVSYETTWNPEKEVVKPHINVSTVSNGKIYRVKDIQFKMIQVSGGKFVMGTDEDNFTKYDDEKPSHEVTITHDYMIAETEVTQELWQNIMGTNPSHLKHKHYPVDRVSWNDCQTFIKQLNKISGQQFRLPTEAEWEYAAQGGRLSKGYIFSGSDDVALVAWYSNNASSSVHSVKTLQPNELGIYDMSGNVWEWCQDWFGNYPDTSVVNPVGASSGLRRVFRGGSWIGRSERCRVRYRSGDRPDFRSNGVGFRLAL